MSKYNWVVHTVLAMAGAFFSVVGFWQIGSSDIPEQSSLIAARGVVESIEWNKYAFRFKLSGDSRVFMYSSKSGAFSSIKQVISDAGQKEVAVLYYPKEVSLLLSSDTCFEVWQIAVEGKVVRTFSQSVESWQTSNALWPWLGGTCLVLSLQLAFLAYRAWAKETISFRR